MNSLIRLTFVLLALLLGEATVLSGSPLPACLAAADVSAAVELEVQAFPSGIQAAEDYVICAYQGANNALGAFVTTTVGPAEGSDEKFSEMMEEVRLFLGTRAELEAIQVGERGYAYASSSKSVAAAVSGGRLYYAEIVSTASADIGDKKAAMVMLIERLMSL